MNQLAIEDCNAQHKSLSQLNSSSSLTEQEEEQQIKTS